MQKTRLFYTTWGSPRRAILSLALVGVFAAALVFWLGAAPALAQTTKPDPVTGVTAVEIGDKEVKLTGPILRLQASARIRASTCC